MTARPVRIHEEPPTLPKSWSWSYREGKGGFRSVVLLDPHGEGVGHVRPDLYLMRGLDGYKKAQRGWIVCTSAGEVKCGRLPTALDLLASEAWEDVAHGKAMPKGSPSSVPVDLALYRGRRAKVWQQVADERQRQVKQWGPYRRLPIGDQSLALVAQALEDFAQDQMERGRMSFAAILAKEVGEVLRAHTPQRVREELIQVAAVCLAALEEGSSEVLDDEHEPQAKS